MIFLKSFEIFINEGISTLIKNKDNKISKSLKKFNYSIGDKIRVNILNTNKYIDCEIILLPYWNDDEDWTEMIVKYRNMLIEIHWYTVDKKWKTNFNI